jgi:hypothetical protein
VSETVTTTEFPDAADTAYEEVNARIMTMIQLVFLMHESHVIGSGPIDFSLGIFLVLY